MGLFFAPETDMIFETELGPPLYDLVELSMAMSRCFAAGMRAVQTIHAAWT